MYSKHKRQLRSAAVKSWPAQDVQQVNIKIGNAPKQQIVWCNPDMCAALVEEMTNVGSQCGG